MKIIKTKVIGDTITPIEQGYVIENQVNQYAIEFDFDETWNFEEKYCIFQDEFEEQTFKRAIINNQVIVPSELLNGRITIQVYGQNIENNVISQRQPSLKYVFSILNSLPTNASEEEDTPTPTQWELYISQIEEMCNDLQDQFDDLKEECETKCDDVIERLEQDEQNIQTNTDNIRTNSENIDKLNNDLLDYSLITETGNKISMSMNSQTYVITLSLKDKNDNILSTQSVDLPLETMIVSASYSNGILTFTLKNGQTLQVPIGDLISGLVSTDTFNQAVQGLSNRITAIENDYLKASDKTELQEQITANADDIGNIQEEQLTQNADIESLQQENERLSRIVEGLPTKQANGTSFVLNDMVKANIKDYELRGNTTQTTTIGKNIFNKNSITNDSWLVENGTISTGHPGYVVSDYIPVTPNTQYYKGNNGSPRNKYYDINKQALDTSTYQDISIGGNAGAFTTPNNAYYLRITINEQTANINNLQIEKGNSATSYEEYTGGAPSPNPSYPQTINVVTGNQTIQCCGKNIFKPYSTGTVEVNNLTIIIDENYNIKLNGTANARSYIEIGYKYGSGTNSQNTPIIPINNETITISTHYFKGQVNGEPYITTQYEQIRSINTIVRTNDNSDVVNNSTGIYRIYIVIPENCSFTNFEFGIQIELGNTLTSYEQYSGTTFPISLGTIELNKIGDYQDKIYKSNDKWYLHKEIGKQIFNGTETYTIGNELTNTIDYRINTSIGAIATGYDEINFYNNRFIRQAGATTDIECSWLNRLGYIRFRINKTTASTIEKFKEWVSNNNIIVYFILATPTDTEITDTSLISQLEDIYNIILNENNTIIINGNLPSDTLVIGYADIAKLISSLSSQDNRSVEENTRKGGNTEEPKKEEKEPIKEPIETKEEQR